MFRHQLIFINPFKKINFMNLFFKREKMEYGDCQLNHLAQNMLSMIPTDFWHRKVGPAATGLHLERCPLLGIKGVT